MQSSLAKISLECVMAGTAVEAQMASSDQFTSVESVQRESVLDSIKYQPKALNSLITLMQNFKTRINL